MKKNLYEVWIWSVCGQNVLTKKLVGYDTDLSRTYNYDDISTVAKNNGYNIVYYMEPRKQQKTFNIDDSKMTVFLNINKCDISVSIRQKLHEWSWFLNPYHIVNDTQINNWIYDTLNDHYKEFNGASR